MTTKPNTFGEVLVVSDDDGKSIAYRPVRGITNALAAVEYYCTCNAGARESVTWSVIPRFLPKGKHDLRQCGVMVNGFMCRPQEHQGLGEGKS